MDLIIYCLILVVMGFIRVGRTSNISDDAGIVNTSPVMNVSYDDIPIGQNLALNREAGAYTLILEELGLM